MGDHPRLNNILSNISEPKGTDLYELSDQRRRIYGTGFRHRLYTSLWVNKDNGEETNIIIKSMTRHEGRRGLEHVYRNEIYFYCAIFPCLDEFQKQKKVKIPFTGVPTYLGGGVNNDREFLFVENPNAAGYSIFEDHFTDDNDIIGVFKMFGKFHALSSVYRHEKPENFEYMCSELVDLNKVLDRMIPDLEESYRSAVNILKGLNELSTEIWDAWEALGNVHDILIRSREYSGPYACFTHGDARANNMLFKRSKFGELEDVKLIHFHKVYMSSPVHDLAFFFYSEASISNLDRLDQFLEIYYESFSSFVKELGHEPQEIYPFHALKREWREYSKFGLIAGIAEWVGMLNLRHSFFKMKDKNNWTEEMSREIWQEMKKEFRNSPAFRKRTKQLILHAIKYNIV